VFIRGAIFGAIFRRPDRLSEPAPCCLQLAHNSTQRDAKCLIQQLNMN